MVGLWVRLLARTRLELFLVITWKELVIEGECVAFSSVEPAILLVSSKNRDVRPVPKLEVFYSLTSVKYEKAYCRDYKTSTQQMRYM